MNTCTIELPEGRTIAFTFDPAQTLLDAAAQAGWELPHSCRRGNCESCRVQVLEGAVHPPARQGSALLCMSRGCGDVRIAADRAEPVSGAARKTVRARLYRLRMAAPDVAVIDLRFPAGVKVPFKAGQYLQVHLDGAQPRSFSMSSAPRAADGVQLQVRVLPGSLFGEQVLPTLKPGDTLALELPFGDFYLREGPAPVIMVAGGTGFAPMQSILEDALARQPERRFTLYWGARRADGLYALEQVAKWQKRHANFRFVGVLSEGEAAAPGMREGLVHEAVLADHADLSGHQVYVCGNPAMVGLARERFVRERALPKASFFADAFATTALA